MDYSRICLHHSVDHDRNIFNLSLMSLANQDHHNEVAVPFNGPFERII